MDKPALPLTESLRRFAEDRLASGVGFREVGWPHGEASVWAVEYGGKTVAFLKQHRQSKKFVTELKAYQEYVPTLGECAPRLMGVCSDPAPALLLSALPGSVVANADWGANVEYPLHVEAARLLRRLHDIPVSEAERSGVEARTRESLSHWTRRAQPHLPSEIIDWAIAQVEAGIQEAPPICVCHKDFSPRNWVATRDGRVALIDFERTRVDFQYLDWSRLWMREWLRRPDLEDAFFAGYGTVECSWEAPMRRLMALHAVGGVAWAIEHDDAKFAQENRDLVDRLRRCSERQ